MRRAAVVLLATLVLSACSGPAGFVAEDEPGWDCRTMGNMRCN